MRKGIEEIYPISFIPYIITGMPYTTLFFDLDDTIYPSGSGLWDAIKERMTLYMIERLAISPDEVSQLRVSYYEQYGTTLRGLQRHHQVDEDDFLAYVHDLPLASYLKPDTSIRFLLSRLPQRKWIFTNADAAHAKRVMSVLDIAEFFDGVVDIRSTGFACKPEEQAYRFALEAAGESVPERCVFLDDSPKNLAPARRLGFYTVLVGTQQPDPAAHHSIFSLHELPAVLPGLLEETF
jgi:putative hydrolase of the HAD superfamily